MKKSHILVVFAVIGIVPVAHAEPTVEIIMEQTTYGYCDKLFYTIKVSEITGNPAIIHIRDSTGKGSSAIPIDIIGHENPVPALIAFNENLFPLGDYFIDVEYEGQKTTAMFTLIDLGKKCLPELLKPITAGWIGGSISDGMLIAAFGNYVDKEILEVPFQVTEQNMDYVQVPFWMKTTASWWIEGNISDDEFAGALQYMMKEGIVFVQTF